MVARIFYFLLFIIILPDLYFEVRYIRSASRYRWWKRLALWLPTIGIIVYTVYLDHIRNFIPDNMAIIDIYLLILGLLVVPKILFILSILLGQGVVRLRHGGRNWGYSLGAVLVFFCWYVIIYGATIGVRKLRVERVELYFNDLPEAFDGYKIVHFTDAHVGSFNGNRRQILRGVVDSINAQRPDLITFTGDLQNIKPCEIRSAYPILAKLHAKDGIYSVLGNHDYSEYVHLNAAEEAANCQEVIALERQLGWRLLLNEHAIIRHGSDSLVIAGEENLEKPDRADFSKTMRGVARGSFVVMLQHNPKAWERYIMPSGRVQLTLSGHVHGGQIAFLGFRPSSIIHKYDYGLFRENGKAMFVSAGIGGLIPFRFGMSPEVVLITLHRLNK